MSTEERLDDNEVMADNDVMAAASARGWRLDEHPVVDTPVWRWLRFAHEIWPTFTDRPAAIAWMQDRLTAET